MDNIGDKIRDQVGKLVRFRCRDTIWNAGNQHVSMSVEHDLFRMITRGIDMPSMNNTTTLTDEFDVIAETINRQQIGFVFNLSD
jgi:hypothetical protein